VDLPIENGDFHSYVKLPEGNKDDVTPKIFTTVRTGRCFFFPADFEHQIPRVGLFSVRSLTQPLVNEAGGFKDWICWGFLFLDMSTDM